MNVRSFSLVDYKVAESEYFLSKISECGFDIFAARCCVSAFSSSARSITFSLQAVLKDIEGFNEWYKDQQDRLRRNPISKFFNKFRAVNTHQGLNYAYMSGRSRGNEIVYYFKSCNELSNVPEKDVVTSCNIYFIKILEIVYDCYMKFGPHIDAHQRYTEEFFSKIGKTIEDAEEEIGLPRGWTKTDSITKEWEGINIEPYRWELIRNHEIGCEINHICNRYLGKTTPVFEKLPELPRKGRNQV